MDAEPLAAYLCSSRPVGPPASRPSRAPGVHKRALGRGTSLPLFCEFRPNLSQQRL